MSFRTTDEIALGKMVVRQHRHENGLTVLTQQTPEVGIVSYQSWFGVGSKHETPGQTGIAHFFEHLMFGATNNFAQGEFDQRIEATSGDNNAATSVDWTYYRDSVPASALELVVELEADRMQNLRLDDDAIESEREVIINERMERVEDDVDGFAEEQLFSSAYKTHPYKWPTIGWMEDIKSLSKEQLQSFYSKYYTPKNCCLVVVGNFQEDKLLELIDRYYGHIAPGSRPLGNYQSELPQEQQRVVQVEKPTSLPRFLAGYHGPEQGSPQWVHLDLVGALLSMGASSRLYRKLVVEQESALSVDCGMYPFDDPSLFRVSMTVTNNEELANVREVIDSEIHEIASGRISKDELNKVKNGVETEFWAALSSCDGRAETLGHYHTSRAGVGDLSRIAESYASASIDEVSQAAKKYLHSDGRSLIEVLATQEDS